MQNGNFTVNHIYSWYVHCKLVPIPTQKVPGKNRLDRVKVEIDFSFFCINSSQRTCFQWKYRTIIYLKLCWYFIYSIRFYLKSAEKPLRVFDKIIFCNLICTISDKVLKRLSRNPKILFNNYYFKLLNMKYKWENFRKNANFLGEIIFPRMPEK